MIVHKRFATQHVPLSPTNYSIEQRKHADWSIDGLLTWCLCTSIFYYGARMAPWLQYTATPPLSATFRSGHSLVTAILAASITTAPGISYEPPHITSFFFLCCSLASTVISRRRLILGLGGLGRLLNNIYPWSGFKHKWQQLCSAGRPQITQRNKESLHRLFSLSAIGSEKLFPPSRINL